MPTDCTHEKIAGRLQQLGNATRLAIYRKLVKKGKSGLSVGSIQKALNIPGSTLSHHLSRLVSVDLVTQDKCGATICCCANSSTLNQVVKYLEAECC